MKTTIQFRVDDQSYTLQPYLTSHGMKLFTDITKLVGADLLALVMQLKDLITEGMGEDGGKKMTAQDLLDADIDNDQLHKILTAFFEKVETDTLDSLFKRILVGTLIDTKGSTTCTEAYDDHFQGKYTHLFKVVWKTLAGQYGDFWSALGAKAKAGTGAVKPKQRVTSMSDRSAGLSGG